MAMLGPTGMHWGGDNGGAGADRSHWGTDNGGVWAIRGVLRLGLIPCLGKSV